MQLTNKDKHSSDMDNELFGEMHEQEENGLYGKRHERELLGLSNVVRSCVHCGNTKDFEVWTELEYNDGSDEPHTGGNYLINVEYVMCKKCGEIV